MARRHHLHHRVLCLLFTGQGVPPLEGRGLRGGGRDRGRRGPGPAGRASHGQRTVPQIFVGEVHVGGYTDLVALDHARASSSPLLRKLLRAGVPPAVRCLASWRAGGITMADIQANTPDPLYDLVGTLYHALKQAAAAERHAADAQAGTRHRARRPVPGRARAIARPRRALQDACSPAGSGARPRTGGRAGWRRPRPGELPRERRPGVLRRRNRRAPAHRGRAAHAVASFLTGRPAVARSRHGTALR